EQYVRTHERAREWFGANLPPLAMALAHLATGLRYLVAAANVMLFARAIEPAVGLAETGVAALVAFDLRERLMATLRLFVRKLVLPALLLVCSAVLLNSAFEVWSSWKQTESLMVGLQREKAEAAAQKIGSFVHEVENQLGWVGQAQWASLPIEVRR